MMEEASERKQGRGECVGRNKFNEKSDVSEVLYFGMSSIYNTATVAFPCLRSYLGESTRSHQNSEVKHLWARLVEWWVTTFESRVLKTFHIFSFFFFFNFFSLQPSLIFLFDPSSVLSKKAIHTQFLLFGLVSFFPKD